MDNKKFLTGVIIATVIITIMGGTLAYWNWQTSNAQKTNVTFTVGSNFSCGADGGGDITNTNYFVPTDCTNSTYAIKRTITTSITNNSSDSVYMDLWLNVNSIGSGLSNSNNFRYALTTSPSSCSTGLVSQGTFHGKTQGDKVDLLSGVTSGSTYYLYVWLDAAETSSDTMNQSVSLSLGGSCTNNTEQMTLYNKVASQADLTTTIDFSQISSDSNGKGVYRFPGTENNTYPVYYYRGDIDNNHVLFGGFCWKIVRTTETGGVKLIYNGTQTPNYTILTNTGNFTWDSSDSTWNATITDGQNKEISFTVPAGDDYSFVMTGTTGLSTGGGYYLYKDGPIVYSNGGGGGETFSYTHSFGTLTASNVIKFVYQGSSTSESPITFKIKMVTQGVSLGLGCNNTGTTTHINTTNTAFNTLYKSPADVGYMYGTRYEISDAKANNWYYAPDVTYANGTYTLAAKGGYNVEIKSNITGTSLNYHHYTCGSTTDTTCTSVRYVYYIFGPSNNVYYMTLSNGKKVEDALSEMLTNSSNSTNSTIKTAIDTWYQTNMTSYTSYLEDTIYCNDRSIDTLNGWNPDGGIVDTTNNTLVFSGNNRANSTYSPSLSCTNKNDSFTVSESAIGNGKLTYPVGLLTSDEAMLAGMKVGSGVTNYLNTGTMYWLGSPSLVGINGAGEFSNVYDILKYNINVNNYFGVRPSVSLKFGMKISGGEGTAISPFEIIN